tara:strand:+ start:461 stop:733 length:273 start_codon:yes stop_codon:yes gene_type:complete
MKFYYVQDVNGYNSQIFSTKKAALDWIKTSNNRSSMYDYGDEAYFTKEDIQVMYVPSLTKKSLLGAFIDISMIVGSKIYAPEVEDFYNIK